MSHDHFHRARRSPSPVFAPPPADSSPPPSSPLIEPKTSQDAVDGLVLAAAHGDVLGTLFYLDKLDKFNALQSHINRQHSTLHLPAFTLAATHDSREHRFIAILLLLCGAMLDPELDPKLGFYLSPDAPRATDWVLAVWERWSVDRADLPNELQPALQLANELIFDDPESEFGDDLAGKETWLQDHPNYLEVVDVELVCLGGSSTGFIKVDHFSPLPPPAPPRPKKRKKPRAPRSADKKREGGGGKGGKVVKGAKGKGKFTGRYFDREDSTSLKSETGTNATEDQQEEELMARPRTRSAAMREVEKITEANEEHDEEEKGGHSTEVRPDGWSTVSADGCDGEEQEDEEEGLQGTEKRRKLEVGIGMQKGEGGQDEPASPTISLTSRRSATLALPPAGPSTSTPSPFSATDRSTILRFQALKRLHGEIQIGELVREMEYAGEVDRETRKVVEERARTVLEKGVQGGV
ncbi:hypothetical protein JCM8097_007452 [Rhodosporidiobolus ruineniae]